MNMRLYYEERPAEQGELYHYRHIDYSESTSFYKLPTTGSNMRLHINYYYYYWANESNYRFNYWKNYELRIIIALESGSVCSTWPCEFNFISADPAQTLHDKGRREERPAE